MIHDWRLYQDIHFFDNGPWIRKWCHGAGAETMFRRILASDSDVSLCSTSHLMFSMWRSVERRVL